MYRNLSWTFNKNPLTKHVFSITSKAQVVIKFRDTYMLDYFFATQFLVNYLPFETKQGKFNIILWSLIFVYKE